MSLRKEQCNKVCRILDDVLANRPNERDSLVIATRKAFAEPHWIPVTERLPEEDGEYLVANLTVKGKPCVYGIDTFANDLYQVDKYDFSDKKGQKGWVYLHDEYGYIEDQTVVAWMPLPEPYKEAET